MKPDCPGQDAPPCPKCGGARYWWFRPSTNNWLPKCKPCMQEYARDWYLATDRDARRDAAFRRAYGVSLAERDLGIEQREGRCDICGEKPTGTHVSERVLCIDHDHEDDTNRGMLCGSCNKKLSWYEKFQESVDRYLAMPPGVNVA